MVVVQHEPHCGCLGIVSILHSRQHSLAKEETPKWQAGPVACMTPALQAVRYYILADAVHPHLHELLEYAGALWVVYQDLSDGGCEVNPLPKINQILLLLLLLRVHAGMCRGTQAGMCRGTTPALCMGCHQHSGVHWPLGNSLIVGTKCFFL